jgi:hypothetical protein
MKASLGCISRKENIFLTYFNSYENMFQIFGGILDIFSQKLCHNIYATGNSFNQLFYIFKSFTTAKSLYLVLLFQLKALVLTFCGLF